MASVQLNIPGCTSITFSTSGAKVPAAGVVTGITAAEAQSLCDEGGEWLSFRASSSAANGNMSIWCPAAITSITVNSNVYTPTAGQLTTVLPADANSILTPPGSYLVVG